MKNYFVIITALLIGITTLSVAQERSATRGVDASSMEHTTLQALVDSMEDTVNRMLACHKNKEHYNTDTQSCISITEEDAFFIAYRDQISACDINNKQVLFWDGNSWGCKVRPQKQTP